MSEPDRSIALGADHGGFSLKEHLKGYLQQQGYAVTDCGTHSTEAVDYPDIAAAVAEHVSDGRCGRGIIIDGAGIGSAMVANRFAGVRAAMCYDVSTARNSREHNDANVLTLGAGLIGVRLGEQIVETWLKWDCTAERHRRRVAKITALDPSGAATGSCGCGGGSGGGSAAVSSADLDRIAARVAELAGAEAPASAAGGDCPACRVCADLSPERARALIDAGAHRIGHRPGQAPPPKDVAGLIDHTLLKPEATNADIDQICDEARQYEFASVCVNPNYVARAAAALRGTSVKVCAVVGFPLGAHVPEIKALEARRAIRDGAREIDMVINVGALRSGECELVLRDIRGIVDACRERGAVCKVILETASLNDEEKVVACQLAREARADFVKTSTGFGGGGATAEDVALMAAAVAGTRMGVKASGGIRDYATARQMIAAGATRLGVSAGVRIVNESKGLTVSGGGGSGKY